MKFWKSLKLRKCSKAAQVTFVGLKPTDSSNTIKPSFDKIIPFVYQSSKPTKVCDLHPSKANREIRNGHAARTHSTLELIMLPVTIQPPTTLHAQKGIK